MIEDKLDIGIINQQLKTAGLKLEGNGIERAMSLQEWYLDQEAITLAKCDECDMYSDNTLPACPFCGDDSEVEMAEIVPLRSDPTLDIVEAAPAVALTDKTYSATDLDDIRNVIGQNNRVAAQSIYRVGQLLALVYDKEIWRLRVDAAGESIYNGFYQWSEAEVGFKHAYTHRVMNVARHFTEDDVEKFGITGLSMGLRVPDERKREFIAIAKESGGLNNIKMRSLANELTVPKEKEKPATAPVVDYSTVQAEIRLGSTLVECKKRTERHAPVNSDAGPAQSISDLPWFDLRISPDLWLAVRVFSNAETGQINAMVELRGVENEKHNKLLRQVDSG